MSGDYAGNCFQTGDTARYIPERLSTADKDKLQQVNNFCRYFQTYRALNGSAPAYLSSYFTRVTDVPSRQRLRSASSSQLAIPPLYLSTVGKRAFQISSANFWNSLPSHVTSAPSLAIFRQRLKTFLIHDLLFLPISTMESRVSQRLVTHSRGWFTLEWTHPAVQACLFHTTAVMN